MSAVSRFAAAFGLKPKAEDNPKQDDDDKKARRAKARERKAEESDEDYAKRCAEEDEKDKAEDEKEKKDAANPAPAPAAADSAAVAQARSEGFAAGSAAERTRWETVLADPRAADRGISACHMLAGTDMASGIILSTLATLPAQATGQSEAGGLATRMAAVNAAVPAPSPGGGGSPAGDDNSPKAVATRINAAAMKARGETK